VRYDVSVPIETHPKANRGASFLIIELSFPCIYIGMWHSERERPYVDIERSKAAIVVGKRRSARIETRKCER